MGNPNRLRMHVNTPAINCRFFFFIVHIPREENRCSSIRSRPGWLIAVSCNWYFCDSIAPGETGQKQQMLLRKRAHGRWWILVTSIPVEGIVGISMISLEQTMVHCRVNTCTEPELVRRSGKKSSRYRVKQYLLSIDVNPECHTRCCCCRWFIHSQWLLHVDMVFTSNRNLSRNSCRRKMRTHDPDQVITLHGRANSRRYGGALISEGLTGTKELILQRYRFPRNAAGRNNPTIWLKRWTSWVLECRLKSQWMKMFRNLVCGITVPEGIKPPVESDGPLTLADPRALKTHSRWHRLRLTSEPWGLKGQGTPRRKPFRARWSWKNSWSPGSFDENRVIN